MIYSTKNWGSPSADERSGHVGNGIVRFLYWSVSVFAWHWQLCAVVHAANPRCPKTNTWSSQTWSEPQAGRALPTRNRRPAFHVRWARFAKWQSLSLRYRLCPSFLGRWALRRISAALVLLHLLTPPSTGRSEATVRGRLNSFLYFKQCFQRLISAFLYILGQGTQLS